MKILIICGRPASLINFRLDLIRELLSRNHEVHCCGPKANEDIIKKLAKINVTYHEVILSRNKISLVKDIRTILSFINLFKYLDPDKTLAYTIKPVIWGGIANRLLLRNNFFALITGLGQTFQDNSFLRKILKKLIIFLYKIALSPAELVFIQNKDNLSYFLESKIIKDEQARIVNGSGVNIIDFSQVPLTEEPKFLMISRLLIDKGVYEYIDAARRIKTDYPDAKFILVGRYDMGLNSVDRNKIVESDKEGIIEYIGPVEDVRKYIKACNFYVLPSYHEGLPRSSLEAMAMGRPLITTDVPGCRETIRDFKNGRIIKPRSSDDLVQKIIWALDNKGKWNEMGQESRRLAEEKFDVRKVNRCMLESMKLW